MPQSKRIQDQAEGIALLSGLNLSQREAVMHGEGPALVLAGPGSGKTTVIVKRIFYLIQVRQIPPEEILVVTFTKDAAVSMQQRFTARAGNYYPVNFGTFHSIFYHILLETNHFGDRPGILSNSQKINILTAILKECAAAETGYREYETLKSDAERLLTAIGFYKNTKDTEASVKYLPDHLRASFCGLFEAYQRQCRLRKLLDFDDMVYECRELLTENPKARAYWQKRFRYLLIDEFQDINPLQYEVVKLLGEQHRNLFAVGDDDQAIYGFRGSGPACLKQFLRELQAKQIVLNANYRSTAEIVSAAEKVIAQNADRFAKNCYAAGPLKGETETVELRSFLNKSREYACLAEELKHFLKTTEGESCGVLFRTNAGMKFLAAALSKEGIPFQMKERSGKLCEHFIVKDLMAYLKLAAGERSREVFLRIMNRPPRQLDREGLGGSGQVKLADLRRWHEERGRPEDTRAAREIRKLETQLAAIRRMSPGLAVSYIGKAVGYERYLKTRKDAGEHLEEWLDILEYLREDAKGYETADAWEQGLKHHSDSPESAFARTGGYAGSGRQADGGSRIRLMTVHASKGLEFDRVWMPDCNEKVYPHGNLPDKETVEEERRIFYVGMTRAKKYLGLLCTTGTKERPRIVSRFLNPLIKSGIDLSADSSSDSL